MKSLHQHFTTTLKVLLILFYVSVAFSGRRIFGQTELKVNSIDGEFGDFFGYSVAIAGDYAIVGAYNDDDNGPNSGSATIFYKQNSSWIEQAKLLPEDGEENDFFGYSVAISGNYAVVGSHNDDDNGSNSGSIYIFYRIGNTWSQQAKLITSDGSTNDFFGGSVSISNDYVVVGAHEHDSNDKLNTGAAYIFYRNGTNWIEQARLTAGDKQSNDSFGNSVSISGDFVIVGSENNDDNGSNSGSAYIFYRSGFNWTEQEKLTARNGETNDYFGCSVALSGEYTIVGAYGKDGEDVSDGGAAYIFYREEKNWNQQVNLSAFDGASKDYFGSSVTLSGDFAIVGAYNDDDNGSNSGSAYIFNREDQNWTLKSKITAGDGTWMDYFGYSTDIDRNNIVVGAYGDEENRGATYFYDPGVYINEFPVELPPPPPPEPEPIPTVTKVKFLIGFILYAVIVSLTWHF